MNDSPGWATPGSSPSEGERPGASAEQPPAQPADAPKWSAEQPPPGQWSSPAAGQNPPPQSPPQPGRGWGGGYPPQPPYGGPQGPQYGYPGGPGPWGKPPAAKPGVIPLRPLGLGEILDGAVATMRAHWRSVLPITLVVATVVQVTSVLVQKYMLEGVALSADEDLTADEVLGFMGDTLTVSAVTQFLQILGTIVVTAMLTMIFSRAVLGQDSSVSDAWREARPQLLRLIALTLLMALGAVLLGAVLLLPGILGTSPGLIILGVFLFIPLVLWLGILFSLASPALMLEKSTVFKAFARSAKLVKGSWWRIFGITLLTGLLTAVVAAIIVLPLQMLGSALFGDSLDALSGAASLSWGSLAFTAVGLIIAQSIVMPIQSGVTVLLYVDQRIRREGLDLELARAAGVEDYGTNNGTNYGTTGG